MKRYYFDGYELDKKYATLWNGYLEFNPNIIEVVDYYDGKTNLELEDMVTDICNINFYVYINSSKIYFSLCQDSIYYYDDFERDIKKVIIAIENKFNIKIYHGEFNATEVKHQGNQYKYTISKDEESNIILKKKILNWSTYESKSKKVKINDLSKKIENIKLN
jgi:hypothetical protein